ncbi:hypothetical protein HYG86_04460 [Alkalicella caledoniensis]|uniref:Uncharacterized protein n=1 Tax=Alkalicella caledoniensis TaxID=2731377 RepID=A0A7G9W5W4_ALKCA|nr:hypothetical protein [Alkalicella caledoniensis]QNO14076.1 hypothetical protein HYG86_04460 [Alkalicella caledoniensis]
MRKYIVLLSVCVIVAIVFMYGYPVKEVVIHDPTYPLKEEIDGRTTFIKVDTGSDLKEISNIIRSAKRTDVVPRKAKIYYRMSVTRNYKTDYYEVVLDPDRETYFIEIDYEKQRGYTITKEQFEAIDEIFKRNQG